MNIRKLRANISSVFLLVILSRGLSLAVEWGISFRFGSSAETDAYYLATSIVQTISPIFTVGIWKIYLPEYSEGVALGETTRIRETTNQLLFVFAFVASCGSFMLFRCSDFIIDLIARDAVVSTRMLTSSLLEIMSFTLVFSVPMVFFSAILESHQEFSKSITRESLSHILPLLFLAWPWTGIKGLAEVRTLGTLAVGGIMVYFARQYHRFSFPRRFPNTHEWSLLKQFPIAGLTATIVNLNPLIDRFFAAGLGAGAISCLSYSGKLFSIFNVFFGTSIQTVLFPAISTIVAKEDWELLHKFFQKYFMLMAAIVFPCASFVAAFSYELVDIIFGHGKFTVSAVMLTADVLSMYAVGIVPSVFSIFVNDFIYILKKSEIVLMITVLDVGLNAMLNYFLLPFFQLPGLSMATSIVAFLTLFVRIYLVKKYLQVGKYCVRSIMVVIFACFVSTAVSYFIIRELEIVASLGKLVFGVLIFGSIYIVLLLWIPAYYRDQAMNWRKI